MAEGDVHVWRGNTGWRVTIEGSQRRAQSTHATQADAWEAGKQIARRKRCDAILHGRDGRIRERNTYSEGPPRSRG
jgi:hypothetical protein